MIRLLIEDVTLTRKENMHRTGPLHKEQDCDAHPRNPLACIQNMAKQQMKS